MRISSGRKKIRVGDLLVEAGAITEEQLMEALAYQKENGGRIGNVIMELGFISQDLLVTVLTTQMGLDYIELNAEVNDFAVTGNASAVKDVKFSLFKWRSNLVLNDFCSCAVTDNFVACALKSF